MSEPEPESRSWRHVVNRASLAIGLIAGSPLVAPQLLAFPYQAKVGDHIVYSERPIGDAHKRVITNADARMHSSPLGHARVLSQPIFLTDGGWRWRWLAVSAGDSLALSRPLGEPVIVNRADPISDQMAGAVRKLSDVLVHEMTHGAIRAHFGVLQSLRMPKELVEGYADHVAGSSRLTDAEAVALLRAGQSHPALVYWTGRKKVEQRLAANGGKIDRLFAEWR